MYSWVQHAETTPFLTEPYTLYCTPTYSLHHSSLSLNRVARRWNKYGLATAVPLYRRNPYTLFQCMKPALVRGKLQYCTVVYPPVFLFLIAKHRVWLRILVSMVSNRVEWFLRNTMDTRQVVPNCYKTPIPTNFPLECCFLIGAVPQKMLTVNLKWAIINFYMKRF